MTAARRLAAILGRVPFSRMVNVCNAQPEWEKGQGSRVSAEVAQIQASRSAGLAAVPSQVRPRPPWPSVPDPSPEREKGERAPALVPFLPFVSDGRLASTAKQIPE